MENTAIILDEKLNSLIPTSNVEQTKAELYALSFAPFMVSINELSKAITLMNKENPSPIDVKTARSNRLEMVKVRTASEKIKDAHKASILVEGRLIDSLNGVIKNTSALIESEYLAIEKHAENLEIARKEKLKIERLELLKDLTDQASIYPLGEMNEDSFNDLLEGLKTAKENKIKAEREAERLRLEAIEAERIENERIRIENEKLKAEAAEAERLAEIERKKNAEALAKLEAEKKAAADKAAAEKKAQDDLIAKQKAEAERLQKQINDKKEAEIMAAKVLKENQEKEAADLFVAQIEAEKAPDKEKMRQWLDKCHLGITPSLGPDGHKKACEIHMKFTGFLKWANEQIDNI